MYILIPVPEIPQNGPDANWYRDDCGAASIGMLLALYGLLNGLTVNQLAAETTLAKRDNGLTPTQLCDLAGTHGLHCHVNIGVSVLSICMELAAGRPVVPLIANRDISERFDQNDKTPGLDGHFFVICGRTDDHFIVQDPDVTVPHIAAGTHMLVPFAELDKALEDTNAHRQAVFVDPGQTPVPIPIPPYAATTTTALNVRPAPALTASKFGTLPQGYAVTVTGDAEGDFVPVRIEAWVGKKYLQAK